jgi:hypothetical protein
VHSKALLPRPASRGKIFFYFLLNFENWLVIAVFSKLLF